MSGVATAARLRICRADLREPVLERVVGALAARLDLPLDRLSDAQIVSAAVASVAGRHVEDGMLCVDLGVIDDALSIAVGTLPSGAAQRVLDETAVPGVGAVLERLVDRWEVETLGEGGERLHLTIGAATPAAS
jgi:serine/threonine-protein kinase RsbW